MLGDQARAGGSFGLHQPMKQLEHHQGKGSAEEVLNSKDTSSGTVSVFGGPGNVSVSLVLTHCLSVEDAACQSADTAAGSTGTPESDEEAEDVGTTSSYFCNNANQRRKRKRPPNFRESKRKKTSGGGSQQFHPKGYVARGHWQLFLVQNRTMVIPELLCYPAVFF